jgi:hypothetical protein
MGTMMVGDNDRRVGRTLYGISIHLTPGYAFFFLYGSWTQQGSVFSL